MSWLDSLLKQINTSIVNVYDSTNTLIVPQRTSIQFKGPFTIADDPINQHTVITNTAITGTGVVTSLTGGGHVTVSASTGAVTLGSDANSSATASTLPLYDASGFLFANSFQFPVADATPTITQGQATSGSGVALTIQAQQGFTSNVGGNLVLKSGAGAVAGTNAAGQITIDVGQAVGGISTKVSLQSAASEFASFWKDSSGISTSVWANPLAKMRIQSGGTLLLNDGTSGTTGDTVTLSLAHGGASSVTWGAGVTGVTYSQAQSASGAGVATTIKTQAGASPGTDLGGALHLDTGATVASASAPVYLDAGGVNYGQFFEYGGQFWIQSTSTTITVDSANNLQFIARTNSVIWFGSGIGTVRVDTLNPTGACSIAWQSGVTSVAETLPTGVAKTVSAGSFQVLDQTSSLPFVEYNHLAAASRVVSLCRNAVITTTNMPASSGDGVINIANAIVVPTANCDNTGTVLYSNAGTNSSGLEARSALGERTELSWKNDATSGTYTSSRNIVMKRRGKIHFSASSAAQTVIDVPGSELPLSNTPWSGYVEVRISGNKNSATTDYGALWTLQVGGTGNGTLNIEAGPTSRWSDNNTTPVVTLTALNTSNHLILQIGLDSSQTASFTAWATLYVDAD